MPNEKNNNGLRDDFSESSESSGIGYVQFNTNPSISAYASRSYDSLLAPDAPWTLECWAKRVGSWSGDSTAFNGMGLFGINGQNTGGWNIYANKVEVRLYNTSATGGALDPLSVICSTSTFNTIDTWHHIALTCDGTDAVFWMDGVFGSTTKSYGKLSLVPHYQFLIAISNNQTGSGFSPFALTMIRISDSVRYSSGFTPSISFHPDANTIALWQFSEGSGTTIGDSSSGLNLSIVGSGYFWSTKGPNSSSSSSMSSSSYSKSSGSSSSGEKSGSSSSNSSKSSSSRSSNSSSSSSQSSSSQSSSSQSSSSSLSSRSSKSSSSTIEFSGSSSSVSNISSFSSSSKSFSSKSSKSSSSGGSSQSSASSSSYSSSTNISYTSSSYSSFSSLSQSSLSSFSSISDSSQSSNSSSHSSSTSFSSESSTSSSSQSSLSTSSSSQSSLSTSLSSISSLSSQSTSSTSSSSSSSTSSQSSLSTSSLSSSSISSSSISSISSESSSSVFEKIIFDFSQEVPKNISLTIDILNKDTLKLSTEQWIGYPRPLEIKAIENDRLRGNLLYNEAVWGFKETTSGYSSKISNAIVFVDDTIVINISQMGHGVGYHPSVPNRLVFCQTTLEITLHDIAKGSHKTLSFDEFETGIDNPKRYIIWKVASIDDDSKKLYNEKGYYGSYVIEVKEKNKWYLNSDFTQEINLSSNMKTNSNSNFIQIFSLWWKNFLSEIDIKHPAKNISILENVNFITSPITIDDNKTTQEIFDENTTYPSYEYISKGEPIDITDEEKDKIIKNNAWNMGASQMPILTSDYKTELLGFGITSVPNNPTTEQFPYVRNSQYLSESIGTKQLYNLNGVPSAYNLHNFLSDITNNHFQSSSKIYNPNRCIWMNKNNQKGDIGFITSSIVTNGAELIEENSFEKTIYTTIDKDIPKAENITSSIFESVFSIQFSITSGENSVEKVSYGIAIDNYGYNTYIDNTGKTRKAEFDLFRQFKEILTPFSIVNIQIGLEDNNGNIYYYYHTHNLATEYQSYVNNLRAFQRKDGSKIVDVFYDYLSYSEISPSVVELKISSDYGQNFIVPTTSISGDVGTNIYTGNNRHVTWNPLVDLPNFNGSGVVFQISALDVNDNLVIGRCFSGNVVVDSFVDDPKIMFTKNNQDKYGIYHGEKIKEDGIFEFEEESYEWISSLSSGSTSMDITSSSVSSMSYSSSSSSLSSVSSISSISSSSSSISSISSLSSLSSSSLSSSSLSSSTLSSSSSTLSSISSLSSSSISSSSRSSMSSQSSYSSQSSSSALNINWVERRPFGDRNILWLNVETDHGLGSVLFANCFVESSPDVGEYFNKSTDYGENWTKTEGRLNYLIASPTITTSSNNIPLICTAFDASTPGEGQRIYTSFDSGSSWTERQPAGNVEKNWTSVSVSYNWPYGVPDGVRFVACVGGYSLDPDGGRMYHGTSNNTWSETQPAGNIDKNWTSVSTTVWGSGNSTIACVGGGRVYVDNSEFFGTHWTETQPAGDTDQNWISTTINMRGSHMAVCAQGGRLYVSSDYGATWTERQPDGDIDKNWFKVIISPSFSPSISTDYVLACTDNLRIYISFDFGLTWNEYQPKGDIDAAWFSLATNWNGTNFIVAEYEGRLFTGTKHI